ncbi:hypothetical protein EV121DRAFT_284869 [Schizophyllum commune]|nr:hypothetical protein K525DRAFT_283488 [Schizophyllum commune Loenen D]
MVRIQPKLQDLLPHIIYNSPRHVPEGIEHDDDVARMPDRQAGPVIRHARSAQRVTQAEKCPLSWPKRCTRRHRDPDNHQRPRARGGGSGVVERRRMRRDGEQGGAE